MLQWLLGDFEVLGMTGQNWMLALAGGLALYIAVLVVLNGRERAQ